MKNNKCGEQVNFKRIKDWNDFYRIVETDNYFKVILKDEYPLPGNGYFETTDNDIKEKTFYEWVDSLNINKKQVLYYGEENIKY